MSNTKISVATNFFETFFLAISKLDIENVLTESAFSDYSQSIVLILVTNRIGIVVGSRTGAVSPFPAPASSNAACSFPALRLPTFFTPRFIWLIVLELLSPMMVSVCGHDNHRKSQFLIYPLVTVKSIFSLPTGS